MGVIEFHGRVSLVKLPHVVGFRTLEEALLLWGLLSGCGLADGPGKGKTPFTWFQMGFLTVLELFNKRLTMCHLLISVL